MKRELRLALAVSDGGDWQLSAECDDELTTFVILNPTVLFGDAEPDAVLASMREPLLAEHLARCRVHEGRRVTPEQIAAASRAKASA